MRVSAARIGVLALFAASALLLGAGSPYRILALYPENREAQAIGNLTAHLENGDVSLVLPDGKVLKGRFEVKAGGSFSAFGKARGLDRPGGAYTSAGRAILNGSPAFVDMKGTSGATAHCEVMNDDGSAHGSGACLFSSGAEYRVLY